MYYFDRADKDQGFYFNSPREAFAALIDKVSGKGTWDSNPFVVVYRNTRESPRLQSWDESASMFFLILDISDYGISRNTSDRLAEIRTRPQRRQPGAQLCKFLTQNSR